MGFDVSKQNQIKSRGSANIMGGSWSGLYRWGDACLISLSHQDSHVNIQSDIDLLFACIDIVGEVQYTCIYDQTPGRGQR